MGTQCGKRQKSRSRSVLRVLWLILLSGGTMVLLLIAQIHPVQDEFTCLVYSREDGSLSEGVLTITGTYWDKIWGEDTFYGSICFEDDTGKQRGGALEQPIFSPVTNGYTAGGLFYYNSKAERYESLGQMFWNVPKNQFVIAWENCYLCYPATELGDLNVQLDMLHMELVE